MMGEGLIIDLNATLGGEFYANRVLISMDPVNYTVGPELMHLRLFRR